MTWKIRHGDALDVLRTLPAATVGKVALRLGRSFIGVDLNPDYVAMGERRLIDDAPLWNTPDEAGA